MSVREVNKRKRERRERERERERKNGPVILSNPFLLTTLVLLIPGSTVKFDKIKKKKKKKKR